MTVHYERIRWVYYSLFFRFSHSWYRHRSDIATSNPHTHHTIIIIIMLQHVPVAWENAHPIVDIADVAGAPDPLFKVFFGGHTAYAALLACDKLGLTPEALFFRSRGSFERATIKHANLPIEGRRPGLDETCQAGIRFIVHERRRQMLFVQLYSVRRALVETGSIGSLWQQRQRLVTGKEAPLLQPPPLPEPPGSPLSPALVPGGAVNNNANANSKATASQQRQQQEQQQSQQIALFDSVMLRGSIHQDDGGLLLLPPPEARPSAASAGSAGDFTGTALTTVTDAGGDQHPVLRSPASSCPRAISPMDQHQPCTPTNAPHAAVPPAPKIVHAPFPAIPEPAPLFRWRTRDVLEKEEALLLATCSKLAAMGAHFHRAEQSRLHEQLTRELLEQELNAFGPRGGGGGGGGAGGGSGLSPAAQRYAMMRRQQQNAGRRRGGDDSSDSASDGGGGGSSPYRRRSALFARPSAVGGKPTVAKPTAAALWLIGESPFSVAGTRPPRPPSVRQPLVTRHGRSIGDDYVSTVVSRHLRVIAKKAAEKIVDVVERNSRDDEIRHDMEAFHTQRAAKVRAPYMGGPFETDKVGALDAMQQRRVEVEQHRQELGMRRLDALVERHERQEAQRDRTDDRKLVTRALSKEAELVRRENIQINRERLAHCDDSRRLVIRASREGRQQRVDLLREQHRAAAWNSRVSHEMEAMIRSQVRDRVEAMQLTRRWELDELPSAPEIAEIFHSGGVMGDWNAGMRSGTQALEVLSAQRLPFSQQRELRDPRHAQQQPPQSVHRDDSSLSMVSTFGGGGVTGAGALPPASSSSVPAVQNDPNSITRSSSAKFSSAGGGRLHASGGTEAMAQSVNPSGGATATGGRAGAEQQQAQPPTTAAMQRVGLPSITSATATGASRERRGSAFDLQSARPESPLLPDSRASINASGFVGRA